MVPESPFLVDLYRSIGAFDEALTAAERIYQAGTLPFTLYEVCILACFGKGSVKDFGTWARRALRAGVRDGCLLAGLAGGSFIRIGSTRLATNGWATGKM